MREIKFRAWDIEAKKWCGYEDTGHIINLYHSITNNCFMVDNDSFDFPSDVILSQYTGLKDKNGVEVYEGDIVICDSRRKCPHEVYWREAAPFGAIGGWGLRGTNGDYDWIGGEEVIGNIHEDPELLEAQS